MTDRRPVDVRWREIVKGCSWDAHIAKVIGKRKSQVAKMGAILTDPHLDTKFKYVF